VTKVVSAKTDQPTRWGPSAAPALLLTKLHPPPVREQTVGRERLIERLRPRAGVKLAVVAAPAGCGKTTLLAAWRDAEARNRPVAWVTLDQGDNDPVVLWSHVLEALRRVCPGVQAHAPNLGGGTRVTEVVLPRLVNELTEQGEIALVLDDFHRLGDSPGRESLAWFIEHAPPSCLVLLGTRFEPALPMGALRAHGELVELRAADLSFTSDEADALLNGRLDLGLAAADVDELVARTEGWPAGLYLAALSLQGVDDRHAFVGRFGGSSRHIVDFMVDEVLQAHDPAMQSLMLRASVLDRFSGQVCDAVLEEEGTAEHLRALARTNLFLVPLDDRGDWFRFHHLFGQLLRVELEHREPGLAESLHARAFAWHRDHGAVDAAIQHGLSAGLFADTSALIARTWTEYAMACRFATILGWLARLPRELVSVNPQLLLVSAWAHTLSGDRAAAATAMAEVEELGRLDDGPLLDGFTSLESSLATLRATTPWGDFGHAIENGRRAADLEGAESPWRGTVCSTLGTALFFSGELDEADWWYAESVAAASAAGQWLVASGALAYRSRIAGEQRRVEEQAELAEQAMDVVTEHNLHGLEGEVLVALAMSLEARGRATEAVPLVEQAVSLHRDRRFHVELADALLCQAGVLEKTGDADAAAAAIREAAIAIDECPDPRTLADRLAAAEGPARKPRRFVAGALSERELVILGMLRGPLSERDIGRELYLSHNTIHSHTRSIYRKLGVSSRDEALRRGRELGLL
jgi:LuxR family maltose regulon positive regulatory protein